MVVKKSDLKILVAAVGICLLGGIVTYNTNRAGAPGFTGESVVCFLPEVLRPVLEPLMDSFQHAFGIEVRRISCNSLEMAERLAETPAGHAVIYEDIGVTERLLSGDLLLRGETHIFELLYLVPALLVAKGNPGAVVGLADVGREGLMVGVEPPSYSAMGALAGGVLKDYDLLKKKLDRRELRQAPLEELIELLHGNQLHTIIGYRFLHFLHSRVMDLVPLPENESTGVVVVRAAMTRFASDPNATHALLQYLAHPSRRDQLKRIGCLSYRHLADSVLGKGFVELVNMPGEDGHEKVVQSP
ncbi:substrate-binding domain-containing protein [bacterium]|nr:substrate-binding domain-containing protein [candidate division CSSED10-310 bacterium]